MKLKNEKDGKPKSKLGFALISSITLLALCLLIAMAMLTLSTTTQRTSNLDLHAERARANAKLALNIAISELQLHLGKDQAATARADILDSDYDTLVPDGMEHPYYYMAIPSLDMNKLQGEQKFVGLGLRRRRAGLPRVLVSGNEFFNLTDENAFASAAAGKRDTFVLYNFSDKAMIIKTSLGGEHLIRPKGKRSYGLKPTIKNNNSAFKLKAEIIKLHNNKKIRYTLLTQSYKHKEGDQVIAVINQVGKRYKINIVPRAFWKTENK